jgi:hypothetical protein
MNSNFGVINVVNNGRLIYGFIDTDRVPEIRQIIFQPKDKVTVILWGDNTKTIVKCTKDDEFVPEVGVAEAIAEKYFGSRAKFTKEVEKAMKIATKRDEIRSKKS